MNNIGANIAKFRKEKKITQEQLASFVSVSAQAVSKWENGGMPDCELLPKIADCLQVSIDALFSRKCEDNISIKQELAKRIVGLPVAERFNEVMEYLWVLQLALAGNNGHFSDGNYKKTIKETGDEYRHSQNIFDEGIIMMSLKEKLQYFLCMPEPDDGWLKNLNNIDDYCKLFAFLGEKDFLNAAILLESIEPYLFNISLLKSNLNITEERAQEIISKLKEYKFITEASIETENGKEKVYHIHSNPALVAVLALATELMKKPTNFTHYHNSRNLRKTFKVL